MVDIPGNATAEEIEKRAMRELKGQLVGITTDRMVMIDAATARLLVDKLPSDEELEETEEEKEKFSMRAPPPAAPEATAAAAKSASPKETRAQLEAKTKEELIDLADDNDIDVAHSWSKADIVDAILKARK